MTLRNELYTIKTIAKRFARAKRIALHAALDLIANSFEHPHWNALSTAWEKGWRPNSVHWDRLERDFKVANPDVLPSSRKRPVIPLLGEKTGNIDGHAYTLTIDMEVLMQGRGWAILIEQAPSESPYIEVTDRRIKANPILDPEFVSKALTIGNAAAEELRSRIAADWPRRSTKPDAEGRALHPLFPTLSKKWHCYHCDGDFTGAQMAANMWHCPHCSATPIDINPYGEADN
jgi:hypothetical protein